LKIILVALYPNSTHIFQPLDVGVFRALKEAWSRYLRQNQNSSFDFKLDSSNFATHYSKVYYEAVTAPVIKSAFAACGIYPWSENAIKFERCMELSRHRKDFPTHQSEFIVDDSEVSNRLAAADFQ
jgi:hypothetical protein